MDFDKLSLLKRELSDLRARLQYQNFVLLAAKDHEVIETTQARVYMLKSMIENTKQEISLFSV